MISMIDIVYAKKVFYFKDEKIYIVKISNGVKRQTEKNLIRRGIDWCVPFYKRNKRIAIYSNTTGKLNAKISSLFVNKKDIFKLRVDNV